MIDFLVYALPRSGSAWLSNFLTYGSSFCYHEPLRNGPLESLPLVAPVTGAADTGAYLFPVTARRTYALVRDPRDVVRALSKLGLPMVQDFELFHEQTRDLVTWRYERLFDVGYLREIWTEVVGPGFNETRARQLTEMTVVWRF